MSEELENKILVKLDEIVAILKAKNEASALNHDSINAKLDKLLQK